MMLNVQRTQLFPLTSGIEDPKVRRWAENLTSLLDRNYREIGTKTGKFDDIITKGPYVDVRAFGAVGDGVTDDTVAMQAALDVGGTIFFPSGVYLISDVLGYTFYALDISNSDTALVGASGAWLKLKDGDYSGKASFYMIYSPDGVDRMTISNLGFDGNRAGVTSPTTNSATVFLYRTKHSKIINCILKNPYGGSTGGNSGFWFVDSSSDYICSGNFIYCDSYDSGYGGCGGIFVQGSRGIITNNTLENLNDAAIIVNGLSKRFVISNNVLTGNVGNIGIENGPTDVVVSGNMIKDTRSYGIATLWIGAPGADMTGINITGNTISGNLGVAVTPPISISRCDDFSVVGNTIKDISTDNANNVLITLSSAEKGLVVGNTCQGGTVGIRTSNVVKVKISDNVIESDYATYYGMQLTNVNTDVGVFNNSIYSGNNGIVAVGGWTRTRVSVRGNIVQAPTPYSGITPEQIVNVPVALANNATPSVIGGDTWLTGGTTTITDLDDGVAGQVITVLCKHSLTFDFTTAQDADHNLDGSSADITADSGDILKFLCEDGTTWHLMSNLDASADNN